MRNVLLMPGLRLHCCQKVASASLGATVRGIQGQYYEKPKRGGRTIYGNPKLQRVSPDDDGPEFRFITLRHPLDRLVSCWAFFCTPQGGKIQIESAPLGLGNLGCYAHMPFGAFLDIALERHDDNCHTRKQVVAAGPHAHKAYLCRLEGLANAWPWMMGRFDYLLPISIKHQTTRKPWAEMYSPEMRVAAEAVFSDDLALYERATNGEDHGQAGEFQAA